MDQTTKQALAAYLGQFVTQRRQARIERVLAQRTRHIAVVLENIFQPHNASAVLRSCDCFGVQDVYIVEDENRYRVNPDIALGASQWLTLYRYGRSGGDNIRACLTTLKAEGYCVMATTLRTGAIPLQDLDVDQKMALCFGTEEEGLSDEAHDLADVFVKIPMFGFTQSFNISVSAALCLYELTGRMRHAEIAWELSEAEKLDLRIDWLCKSTRNSAALARHFFLERGLPIPPQFED